MPLWISAEYEGSANGENETVNQDDPSDVLLELKSSEHVTSLWTCCELMQKP